VGCRELGRGSVLEVNTATLVRTARTGPLHTSLWRASADWSSRLGYSDTALADTNRAAIALLAHIRDAYQAPASPMVISGCVGPRGDGYVAGVQMTAAEAEQYHSAQIATFQHTAADMVTAITMNYADEAIGIARAAARAGMPVAISFTVETDGRLPTGQSLAGAITQVDAATGSIPAYYMINCAHPSHFAGVLADEPWAARIRGLRANASAKSHAELNESPELDSGDPLAYCTRPCASRRPRPTSIAMTSLTGGLRLSVATHTTSTLTTMELGVRAACTTSRVTPAANSGSLGIV
jgi:S-methylmethionine-dependent homocysteine/selenocysteine methylase